MVKQSTELLKGTLDMWLLKTLALETKHGVQISDRTDDGRRVRQERGIVVSGPATPAIISAGGGRARHWLRARRATAISPRSLCA